MTTMRRTRTNRRFRREYKRVKRGQYRETLDDDLQQVIALPRVDEVLPERYQDHPLSGRWIGHRECHIHPDLLLIYRKPDAETLELVRLGSHSELDL